MERMYKGLSDEEIQQHFSKLFEGSEGCNLSEVLEGHNVNIPVLDDNITTKMRNLKINKANGPDGVCPAVIKALLLNWVITLASLFNTIFTILLRGRWAKCSRYLKVGLGRT